VRQSELNRFYRDVRRKGRSIQSRNSANLDRSFNIPIDELLNAREDERQRISQELHDSAGQLLVALQLSVAHLQRVEEGCGHDELMIEINETVAQIDSEIRSLAFMEYPAHLGDRSLVPAVQSLCRDFGRRAGIGVTFESSGDFVDVAGPLSTAVLRVVQEALVNIHRHAHASSATVTVEHCGDQLQFAVADDGIGISSGVEDKPRGIGLQGMRHRVEALGGRFQIENMGPGMKVSGSLPLAA
jgi:signal transduction histidine kinase